MPAYLGKRTRGFGRHVGAKRRRAAGGMRHRARGGYRRAHAYRRYHRKGGRRSGTRPFVKSYRQARRNRAHGRMALCPAKAFGSNHYHKAGMAKILPMVDVVRTQRCNATTTLTFDQSACITYHPFGNAQDVFPSMNLSTGLVAWTGQTNLGPSSEYLNDATGAVDGLTFNKALIMNISLRLNFTFDAVISPIRIRLVEPTKIMTSRELSETTNHLLSYNFTEYESWVPNFYWKTKKTWWIKPNTKQYVHQASYVSVDGNATVPQLSTAGIGTQNIELYIPVWKMARTHDGLAATVHSQWQPRHNQTWYLVMDFGHAQPSAIVASTSKTVTIDARMMTKYIQIENQ